MTNKYEAEIDTAYPRRVEMKPIAVRTDIGDFAITKDPDTVPVRLVWYQRAGDYEPRVDLPIEEWGRFLRTAKEVAEIFGLPIEI